MMFETHYVVILHGILLLLGTIAMQGRPKLRGQYQRHHRLGHTRHIKLAKIEPLLSSSKQNNVWRNVLRPLDLSPTLNMANLLNRGKSERHESARIEFGKRKKKMSKGSKSGNGGLRTNKFLHQEMSVKQVRSLRLHRSEKTEGIAKPNVKPKKRRSKPRLCNKKESRL